MAPKGKSPKPTKKVKRGSVPRRLFDEEFDYKKVNPLLKKQRKTKALKSLSHFHQLRRRRVKNVIQKQHHHLAVRHLSSLSLSILSLGSLS